ncbi:porin [Paraburkholderia sediminicola]|uniref:porin n=1 Tax=Paraburkholderia sediminicola TaxID=458836 RepID=UPI000F233793
MNYFFCLLMLAGFPLLASAQSSVTLYGVIGNGVRWINGTNGGSTVKMASTITPSWFGFQGSEDIGGGLKVIFRLENGFDSPNGNLTTSNVLFQRAAYVGLDGQYGRLTMGRQLTSFEDLAISLDPYALAGGDAAISPGALTVVNVFTGDTRFNNVLKYTYVLNGVKLSANYSLGGVAGNQRAGANYSMQAAYQQGALFGGIGYQRTYNADATQMAQNYQAGGAWQIGPVRLFLNYLGLLISGSPQFASQRRDSIPQGGIVYQITPSIVLTAAFYDDIANNLGNVGGASGHKTTAFALAQYFLSKRTDLYAEIDRNSFSGAYKTDPTNLLVFNRNAASNATVGVSLGFATHF